MRRPREVLALVALLAGGCTTTPVATPDVAPTLAESARPVAVPEPPPPPMPFSDRELADALRQQGIGVSSVGQSGAQRPSGEPPGDDLPELKETPRGVVITLPHTYFPFDRADLDPGARRVVDRIAYVLNHPRALNRSIVLEGHADAIGTEAYNLALSRQRAETVARELIAQGTRQGRITIEAYGESRPVASNHNPDGTDNPAGRARNRRVEAVIRQ